MIPPVNGHQDGDSPAVVWFQGRPFCATCSTGLNAGTTVGMHGEAVRPSRVSVCPVCP
jgi:hypothetical protein